MDIRRSAFLAVFLGLPLAAAPAHALITFGPPAALNSTAATDSSSVDTPDNDGEISLASGGGSNWVAMWSSDNSLGNTVGDDFDIFVATSSDEGKTWSSTAAAMPDAATDGLATDKAPRVAGGGGVFVAVFTSTNTLGGTKGNDFDIVFSRSTNNGATWSSEALLNSGGSSDSANESDDQPSIATDGAGKWVVVWKHHSASPSGYQNFFSYSTNNGVTWAAQQPLGGLQGTSVGNGQGTSVAWTGTSFVVAWGSSEDLGSNGNDGDILTSIISVPGFTASPPALLNNSGTTDGPTGADQYPALAANGAVVVATWSSNANVGGAGTDHDILVSRSTNGGVTWSPAAPLGSNATTDVGEDLDVSIANQGGTFVAVWDSTDPLGKLAKKDADIFVVRSNDNGATWTPTAVLTSTAATDLGADTQPSIAANSATGAWNVAWQSTDTLSKTIGTDLDILYVHSSEDCPASPVAAASCFESTQAGASRLTIKEGGDKDSFLWKFAKGALVDKAMDIGNPMSTDDYVLCVYDEAASVPTLITELDIEAGGNCFSKPCWLDKGTGYALKNKYGIVTSVTLTAGAAGTSLATVQAKSAFHAPPMPLSKDTKVSVRLHNLSNGKCFATDFSTAQTNTAEFFKAKAD